MTVARPAPESLLGIWPKARPLIAHFERKRFSNWSHDNGHCSAAVFVSVLQQDLGDLGQHRRRDRGDRVLDFDNRPERTSLGGQATMPSLLEVPYRLAQVRPLILTRSAACHGEERFDRALQPVDLRDRQRQLRLVRRGEERGGLELEAQGRERRAQLVGGVGAKSALAAHELADAS
jgi:hypothetical protein